MMHTECDLSPVACLAEPMLLMSVLDNLYSNAVHYGSESGTIYLRSQQVGSMLRIEVANTGQPIPATEREMIFEPFYQGSLQRKGAVKGSGLGLSIAQDCIRRMHGELRLDPATHQVTLSGQAVELAPREYALLRLLLENSGKVLSRNQLEQSLYGWSGDVESNAIEVHVHHLRRKLGNQLIRTVRGIGYGIDQPAP